MFELSTNSFNTLSDGDAIAVLHVHDLLTTPSVNRREYFVYITSVMSV